MKFIILCLVALAVFQCPADAFITSLIGSVVDSFNSAVTSVSNTVSTVSVVGQFLWDNALSPSLQVLQNSNTHA